MEQATNQKLIDKVFHKKIPIKIYQCRYEGLGYHDSPPTIGWKIKKGSNKMVALNNEFEEKIFNEITESVLSKKAKDFAKFFAFDKIPKRAGMETIDRVKKHWKSVISSQNQTKYITLRTALSLAGVPFRMQEFVDESDGAQYTTLSVITKEYRKDENGNPLAYETMKEMLSVVADEAKMCCLRKIWAVSTLDATFGLFLGPVDYRESNAISNYAANHINKALRKRGSFHVTTDNGVTFRCKDMDEAVAYSEFLELPVENILVAKKTSNAKKSKSRGR